MTRPFKRAMAQAAATAAAALAPALPQLAQAAPAAPAMVATATPTTTATASNTPPLFPISDFFDNPERGTFRLSDDGVTLGFLQPVRQADGTRRMNVFVQALAGSRLVGEPRLLTHESARDIEEYTWKGSGTILYTQDAGGDENYHVVSVDVASGAVTDLTPGSNLRADIVDDLPGDPHHILVQTNERDPEVFDVMRIDLRTARRELVALNPGDLRGWQADHHGHVRVATRLQGVVTTLMYRADDASPWRALATFDHRTAITPLFFTADDRRLVALSNRGRDLKALVEIDPAHPEAERVLFAPGAVDADDAAWSRRRALLTRVDYEDAKPRHEFIDADTARLWARIRARLPGQEIDIQSETLAEDKFVVATRSDRTIGRRYLYDAKTDTTTLLAELNPKIPEAAMAELRPITYRARDGLEISGYLVLPTAATLGGREAKHLACILQPHGGPWARDHWGWNPEVQFLANRGYCVLQMNFRGSTGYGRRFWEAGFGQWGLKMQDDLTDGAQWLVAQGIADPKRLGIYGGSYGGYATLAGIVYTPDLYAAAVDYVGVSNLLTFMQTVPPYWRPQIAKWHEKVGDPVRDKARLEATSPALHAERIKAPLFIAQGARDPRVNKAESDQMVAALKARGVDVEYMVRENEGHGFQNEENQKAFYAAMERFLGQHLHPERP